MKIEAPNAAVASIVAKMEDARDLAEMIWAEVLEAFEQDKELVALVSQMDGPRLLYTIDGVPALKGKTWRIPFSAFFLDATKG